MELLSQLFVLSLYLLFTGFCFCDGFKLHITRKLIWFAIFVIVAVSVFKSTQLFMLEKILPLPLILAFVLCWFEKRSRERNKSV